VNGRRLTADPLMTIDTADMDCGEYCCTTECRTRTVMDDFYQCQIHRADCGHAVSFGTSYLCMSDRRREYSVQRQLQEVRQLESIL
jgi:hypothetical protein